MAVTDLGKLAECAWSRADSSVILVRAPPATNDTMHLCYDGCARPRATLVYKPPVDQFGQYADS